MSEETKNGVGTTHSGILYTNKQYPPYPYNLWLPFTFYIYFAGTGYVAANMQVALSGFHVPGPASISLLGLGGLVALRRRRVRPAADATGRRRKWGER